MEHTRENDANTIEFKKKTRPRSTLSNRGVLLTVSSNNLGRSYIIDKNHMILGRSSDCDITIDDPLVSKEHCEIVTDENGKFHLQDLGSTNSTFVNEKAIKKLTHLIFGDRIIIGNTILRFYLEEKI